MPFNASKICFRLGFASLAFALSAQVRALPIGFGEVPADRHYEESKTKHFNVYHDKRTRHESRMILGALEGARPHLDRWFRKKRNSALPVVVSATTDNASFANFITDALELQTMGMGSRDLVWHEYVHENMYRHFKNWLGPAGSILHLIWLPSWFVEGLAESLSVSIGSYQQSGVERYHALTGRWPSYARLHSLYTSAEFSFRGYALSGSFVSFLLKRGLAEKLPAFLSSYYYNSMPWYWPYSILPLRNSMPLDRSLKAYLGKTGEELYEEYKKEAEQFWKARIVQGFELPPDEAEDIADIPAISSLQVRGDRVFVREVSKDHNYYDAELIFNGSWAKKTKRLTALPEKTTSQGRVYADDQEFFVTANRGLKGNDYFEIHRRLGNDGSIVRLLQRQNYAGKIFLSQSNLVWEEFEFENSRICQIPLNNINEAKTLNSDDSVKCVFQSTQPESLEIIGSQPYNSNEQSRKQLVWLKKTHQYLDGDLYQIYAWEPDTGIEKKLYEGKANPIAATLSGTQSIILFAEVDQQILMEIDPKDGHCLAILPVGNLSRSVQALSSGDLIFSVFNGSAQTAYKLNPSTLKKQACRPLDHHRSPLLAAIQSQTKNGSKDKINLASVLKSSKNVKTQNQDAKDSATPEANLPTQTFADVLPKRSLKSQPARWRGRSIFAVPWLGADASGSQIGVLSVPIMDQMQNEDVRVYFGYGVNSRYPNTQVSLTSTRFWPTLKLDIFRTQTWNGRYFIPRDNSIPASLENDNDTSEKDEDVKGVYNYAYLDEKGTQLSGKIFLHRINCEINVGLKLSELRPYIGPTELGGPEILSEPFINFAKSTSLGSFRLLSQATVKFAPKFMNETYDYNTLGLDLSLSRSFSLLNSSMRLSTYYSRQRGKHPRELQEVYRPLSVFIAGASGYNNLNFPLYGSGALFRGRYGDTSGQVQGTWGFPIIEKVDRLVRLFYWDSLTFAGTLNYGGAWEGENGKDPKRRDLVGAHIYNLNANFDIKGLNFHLGGGLGQAFGNFPDLYASFSFDAIF